MAWNSTKVSGDLIKSTNWNDFVDFAELISSNRSWSTVSGATDITWSSTDFDSSGLKWNDATQKWIAVNVTAAGGGINNVVEDVSPQLGGDLDGNTHGIDTVTYVSSQTISGGSIKGTWIGDSIDDAHIDNDITLTNITQITNRSHTDLSNIGSNTHTQIDTHISDSDKHFLSSNITDWLGGVYAPTGTTGGITGWQDFSAGTGITSFGGSYSISGGSSLTLSIDDYIASANAVERFADSSNINTKVDAKQDTLTGDEYYPSSIGVGLSGSFQTHTSDSTIHFTKSSIDDDYAGSSNYSTHKLDSTIHFTKGTIDDDYYPSSLGKGVSSQVYLNTLHSSNATIHFTQSNITTVGTVGTGVWEGTSIDEAFIESGSEYQQAYQSSQLLKGLAFRSIYGITGASDIDDGVGGGWDSTRYHHSGIMWDASDNRWEPMPSGGGGGAGDTSTTLTIATASGIASTVSVLHDGSAGILYLNDIPQNILKSGSEYWNAYLSGQVSLQAISDGVSGWVSSDFTNSGLIWNGSNWVAWKSGATGGGISNIVEDVTPQLGGELDCNGNGVNDATFISSNGKVYGTTFNGAISGATLGTPDDGSLSDGCLSWTTSTKVTNALDDVNEILNELAPADATALAGALVDNITLHSGRLASGANLTYETGYKASSSVSYILNDVSFTLDNASQSTSFNKADEGTMKCYINDVNVDTMNLANAFVEDDRDSNQDASYSSNNGVPFTTGTGDITIESVGKYNNFQKWQKGNIHLNITCASDLVNGYNWIYISHEGLATPVSSNNFKLWYDSNSDTTPSLIGTPKIVENTGGWKYLSGIKNYYYGSTFNVTCSSNNCFQSAYRTDRRVFRIQSMTGHTAENILLDNASIDKPNPYPITGDVCTLSNYTITLNNYNTRSTNARATCYTYNAYAGGTTQSASEGRLVDTYRSGANGTSNVTNEYFDDEWYRMPPGAYDSVPSQISGAWDSATVIADGSGQVYSGRLYYPTVNFTSSYLPSQDGSANFSTYSNNAVYYRVFKDAGTPHTNGQLELGNLLNADVDPVGTGDVNVEIKLPTQTGWLDLGSDYDSGSFSGSDSDGCRTAQSGDDWSWTSGTYSSADSGYLIVVRITIRNSSKNLTSVREVGW